MDLDKLQAEVEKLLSLLQDRQPGLISWNMFMEERLKSIVKMIAAAGITAEDKNDTDFV
jgi:hypothetical protein